MLVDRWIHYNLVGWLQHNCAVYMMLPCSHITPIPDSPYETVGGITE